MNASIPKMYALPHLGTSVRALYPTLAFASLVSTLLLITLGSVVRVTGYGLGCPDWPLCYGRVVPPFQLAPWVEFIHRLFGVVTSLQILALAVLAWREYRRETWIFRPAAATVGLLMVQIGLGGLHVLFEIPPVTGWIHTGVAMVIVGLIAMQVAVIHPTVQQLSACASTVAGNRRLRIAIAMTAAATYFLLLTGAYVTRSGASLVCPAFPQCGAPASLTGLQGLIDIQMLHRFTAFGVGLITSLTLGWLVRTGRGAGGFQAVALVLAALFAIQFGLGISNVLLRLPLWARTLHLLVAAMLWTGWVMLWALMRQGSSWNLIPADVELKP